MKTIGEYEVLGLLGKGGMSLVYKVLHRPTERIMALKLLSPHPHLVQLLGHENIRKRFESEAGLMANLRHTHIVGIHEFGEDRGTPYIVMDYYCQNLGSLMGETYRLENPCRALRVDRAIRFARETLDGLSVLHRAGIVHRDIKPFNILLTDDETVRISDFGLSKLRGEVLSGPRQLIVGSPYYAAPEQEGNPDEVDARSDLYSLGVMLFRMLTGRLPGDDAVPPSTRNPDLDADWDAFLLRAMAPDRASRHDSAETMLHSLGQLEKRWREKTDKTCKESAPSPHTSAPERQPGAHLRTAAIRINPRNAADTFQTNALWQPLHYTRNQFEDLRDGTVSDRATGLIWQKAASEFRITWNEAHEYVGGLNKESFAGRDRWRLPTVDELMSLLIPVPHPDDYCMEPIFGRAHKQLWSADRRSFSAAWYASADMGYISWQDFTCRFFVRAVSSG